MSEILERWVWILCRVEGYCKQSAGHAGVFLLPKRLRQPMRVIQRQLAAIDDADVERERIDAFDAAEIDPIARLVIYSIADVGKNSAMPAEIVVQILVVPQIDSKVTRIRGRYEVGSRDVSARQYGAAADA